MWTKHSPDDFNDPELLEQLRHFIPEIRTDFDQGTRDIELFIERASLKDAVLPPSPEDVPPLPTEEEQDAAEDSPVVFSPSFMDNEPVEIARQITIKQSTLFRKIRPEELLNLAWSKTRDKSNVKMMIQLSNKVGCGWTISDLLTHCFI